MARAKKKPYGVIVSIVARTGDEEDNELLTDEGAKSAPEQMYKRQVLEDITKDAVEEQVAQWQDSLGALSPEEFENLDWLGLLREWNIARGRLKDKR